MPKARKERTTQDEILVHRALNRQKRGATRLVEKYRGLVVSVLNRYVKDREQAQDLAQETFLQAFRNLASLKDLQQFRSWLMKIAQRAFLASTSSDRWSARSPSPIGPP
ncbi:MAG: sigma-70 family RNA polymerase sigma factor [Candidatus Riflebacteria bacterium]|nr:sigma-70 family RNA polymerase sigma factor [Candidatus Riflebacteria bacterium]